VNRNIYITNCEGPVSTINNACATAKAFLPEGGKLSTLRGSILVCIFLLMPFFSLQARDNLVFCQMGDRDPALWSVLKKYFTGKSYGVSIYEGADSIEKQIQNVNKISKEKAVVFLALDLIPSEKEGIFVAMSKTKEGKGSILEIDEVPAAHRTDSEDLALSVAAPFGAKIKRLPLFVFLGIDMPGVFLKIDCPKDKTGGVFNRLNEGLQKYLNRGVKDENERKN